MSRILIHTAGTLGDHLPAIALGRALAGRGHRVTMALNRAMVHWAERAGLETAVCTDVDRGPEEARLNAWAWDHWNNPDPGSHPKARPLPPGQVALQARELAGLCAGADLLIATSIRALGLIAQRATGIPWLTFSLNPYAFWRPVDPVEREALRRSSQEHYQVIREALAPVWDELAIRSPYPDWSFGWNFARHVLLASSPAFSRPDLGELQPRQSIDMTGFWFYEDPAWDTWRPDPDLEAFCMRRPIVLTFSSQPLEDPAAILSKHVEAASRLRVPLLVQRGWAGFAEEDLPAGADRGQVMFADFLPQDWLFARACCSIQHGGIGSIARAVRRGCPVLVEPFGNDQVYNASRVSLLGIGAAVHPFETSADGIAQTLKTQVLAPDRRQRTQVLGAQIAAEQGLERACNLVEVFLARPEREDGRFHPWRVPALCEIGEAATPGSEEASPTTSIPRVVHQSWRDAVIPDAFARWRESWGEQNPGWEIRLWTDEENRELIRRDYPWFLPIYDGYAEAIMRADAARCFVLHRHGGVYADLDCESLGPLDVLCEGRRIVFGLEPEMHRERHFPSGDRLPLLLTNAFMASVPGHPFWEHLFREFVRFHKSPGPLDATGPFLLTRAFLSWPGKDAVPVAAPALVSPVESEEEWDELPAVVRGLIARTAFAVHHWTGSWWRAATKLRRDSVRLAILEEGRQVSVAQVSAVWLAAEGGREGRARPLVSCLMVTRDRPALSRRAVRCFLAQTWRERELVIVDDGDDSSLEEWVIGLGEERIRYLRLDAGGRSLGELRNMAVSDARGEFVAQWDDDDLSDPWRIEGQMAALAVTGAAACLLERHQLWWPAQHRLALSCRRLWEGSFLALKEVLASYPTERRGEDSPVIDRLVAGHRVAVLDAPWLYTYLFHGENTFGAGHWEEHWQAATETFEGQHYWARIRETLERIGIEGEASEQEGGTTEGSSAASEPSASRVSPGEEDAPPTVASSPRSRRLRREFPPVLVLTPVRDAVPWLPRHIENLRALDWPRERLSLAFLEGDSADGTHDWLLERLGDLRREFARVELYKRDHAFTHHVPRWEPGVQARRRSVLARVRNELLARALRDEEWVLWVDADLVHWPPETLDVLLGARREIVAPHCLAEGTGETFDLNTFKYRPGAEGLDWSRYLIDDILQPPRGYGRFYLSDLRDRDLVEVDGVGGTMLLVRADLHREGLIFPAAPYRQHIETEGLAFLARDLGYRCWGLPRFEVWHR